MARSQADIKKLMDDIQATKAALVTLTSPSQTADYSEWKDVVAQCLNLAEQLYDTLRDEINSNIDKAAAGNEAWIQDKVLKFQYSALTPQILQIIQDDLGIRSAYATIDESLRIISRCAVKTDLNKIVQVKVAKSEPPVPLATAEYSSLYGYLTALNFAGISFSLINLDSDKLYMVADVYYDGQYTATIQDAVETAIEEYLKSIPFDGIVLLSDLQQAIKQVPGVKDIEIFTVKARQDTVPLGSASIVYDLSTGVNAIKWNTISGYIVGETTGGSTLSDTITYKVA